MAFLTITWLPWSSSWKSDRFSLFWTPPYSEHFRGLPWVFILERFYCSSYLVLTDPKLEETFRERFCSCFIAYPFEKENVSHRSSTLVHLIFIVSSSFTASLFFPISLHRWSLMSSAPWSRFIPKAFKMIYYEPKPNLDQLLPNIHTASACMK